MNVGQEKQKQGHGFVVGGYNLREIGMGALILLLVGAVSFATVFSIKKIDSKSTLARPSVQSTKLSGLSNPIGLATGGNWSLTNTVHLGDYVEAGEFSAPKIDDSAEVGGSFVTREDDSVIVSLIHQGPPEDLEDPILSHESGYYEGSEFPINLQITNPNSLSTWLMLSVNGRPFSKYETRTLLIYPGDTIEAYVRGETERWNESGVARGRYLSKTYQPAGPDHIPVTRIRPQY